jgi:hypothetical protein
MLELTKANKIICEDIMYLFFFKRKCPFVLPQSSFVEGYFHTNKWERYYALV